MVCSSRLPDPDHNEANARLFAAAPELLEALKNIINNLDSGAFQIVVLDDGKPHAGNLDGIRELIKKATGKPQVNYDKRLSIPRNAR